MTPQNIPTAEKELSGRVIAQRLMLQLEESMSQIDKKPNLAIILVGTNPQSILYVAKKKEAGKSIGIKVLVEKLDSTISKDFLITVIKSLCETHTGVMLQLPLPEHLVKYTEEICSHIPVKNDVDMLNSESVKLYKRSLFTKTMPPVAHATQLLLREAGIFLFEKGNEEIVIVGNGATVGQPVVDMMKLYKRSFFVVDKNTSPTQFQESLKSADIVISGTGVPRLIKPEMIKEGVILIDAGISFVEGKVCGDIDRECYTKASFYSPVPGGVGPLTIACLLSNLYILFLESSR